MSAEHDPKPPADGGPAFPPPIIVADPSVRPEDLAGLATGMSLRAYLAGQALGGLVQRHPETRTDYTYAADKAMPFERSDAAELAVKHADLLLAELAKPRTKP